MIPEFPQNIRIRLAKLKLLFLHPEVAKCLPFWMSQLIKAKLRQPTGQRVSNVRVQRKKKIFFYWEESLASSNLNSKLFRFHCVRPNVHIYCYWKGAVNVPIFVRTFLLCIEGRRHLLYTAVLLLIWSTIIIFAV